MLSDNKLMQYGINIFSKLEYKPIFISISGAHLYGFPSKNSDIDLRATHIIKTDNLFKLRLPKDVINHQFTIKNNNIDFESFEIQKTINLMLKNNHNVLEQIFAKNLFLTSEHNELRRLAKGCISKKIFNPYNGMAEFNYRKFIDSGNPLYNKTVKKYLYVIRGYLAGTYALETGNIEPNIQILNKKFNISEVDDLIEMKKNDEKEIFKGDILKYDKLILSLKKEILIAKENSKLPKDIQNKDKIEEWLYKLRIKYL